MLKNHILNKLFAIKSLSQEFKKISQFGFVTAFRLVILSIYRDSSYRQKAIYKTLYKLFAHIPIQERIPPKNSTKIIWTLWWQGRANAPEIVQKCFKQFEKNKPEGYEVIVLDQDNWNQYIQISPRIFELVNNGNLSIAHLSDIIRAKLLMAHGGVWLDSTIFTSQSIPPHLLQAEFLSLSIPIAEEFVSLGKWGGFALGSAKNSALSEFIVTCLDYYWEHHSQVIDYFLFDYIIRIAYERNPTIQNLIDSNTYLSPNLYSVQKAVVEPITHTDVSDLLHSNIFHKLTWKNVRYDSYAFKQICAY